MKSGAIGLWSGHLHSHISTNAIFVALVFGLCRTYLGRIYTTIQGVACDYLARSIVHLQI